MGCESELVGCSATDSQRPAPRRDWALYFLFPSVHLFDKYLLNAYHVLGTGLDFGDIAGNRPDKN